MGNGFAVSSPFCYNRSLSLVPKLMVRQKGKKHKISLIFPIFEESFVVSDIKNLGAEFAKRNQKWEAICVIDSSLERTTSKLKLARLPYVKILSYPLKRLGKGFALCYGFSQSKGDLVFFWEGNFSISSKQLILYLDLIELFQADVVIGSKRHPLSLVYYSPLRRLCSKLYQFFVRLLFGLNLTDTQAGLSLYRRAVLDTVIPKIIIKNWTFDLEILVVAHNFGFKRIIEAPIEIRKHFTGKDLKVSLVYCILRDTLAVFYRKHLLKYYRQDFI